MPGRVGALGEHHTYEAITQSCQGRQRGGGGGAISKGGTAAGGGQEERGWWGRWGGVVLTTTPAEGRRSHDDDSPAGSQCASPAPQLAPRRPFARTRAAGSRSAVVVARRCCRRAAPCPESPRATPAGVAPQLSMLRGPAHGTCQRHDARRRRLWPGFLPIRTPMH